MATGVGPSSSASAKQCSHEISDDDLNIVSNALHPMAGKYLMFGIQIGVKMSEIKNIPRMITNPDECLLEVLSLRLKQIPSLTWNDIHTALVSNSVGEVKLANEIKKKYGHLFSPDPSSSQAALEEESGSFVLEKGTRKRRTASRRKHGTQVSVKGSCAEISEGGCERKRYKKSSKGKKRCHPLKKRGRTKSQYFGRFAKKRSKQDKKVTEREVAHEKEGGSEAGVDSEGNVKEAKKQTKSRVSPAEKQRNDESESEASSENEISSDIEMGMHLLQNQQIEMKRKRKGGDIRRKSKHQRYSLMKKKRQVRQESSSSSRKRRSVNRRKHGTQVSIEDSAEEVREGAYENKWCKKSSKGKKRCHPFKKGGRTKGKYFGHFAKKRSKQDNKVTEREVVHKKEMSSSASEAGVDSEGIVKEAKKQTESRVSPAEKQRNDESESSEANSENEMSSDTEWSMCLSQNQQVVVKRKRKGGDIRRKFKRQKEERQVGQDSSSSSSEIDDSSPECDINFSENETKELRKVFRCFFGKLCCVIKDPVETAAELQAKRVISQSTMESILRSPESNQEKAIGLVKALEKRIKCRLDRIFTIISVFQHNKLLENAGREMWIETGWHFYLSFHLLKFVCVHPSPESTCVNCLYSYAYLLLYWAYR